MYMANFISIKVVSDNVYIHVVHTCTCIYMSTLAVIKTPPLSIKLY